MIIKDTSAKFVDRMSVIGGTFGLWTGFALISGVEILFFLAKFFENLVGLAGQNNKQIFK